MQSDNNKIEIDIESLSSEGKGVSRYRKGENICKVEIAGTVPGDHVLVQLGKRRRSSYKGYLETVLKSSTKRVQPECVHVPICGGCTLQQMAYEEQLKWKQKNIEMFFASYVQEGAILHPILACSEPMRYRNKMEFSFSQNKEGEQFLGLMMGGGRGKVLSLSQCLISPTWFETILLGVKNWWKESSLQAYHHAKDLGSLRTLTFREGRRTKDKMIILTVSGNPEFALKKDQIDGFVKTVLSFFSEDEKKRVSIFLRVQQIQKGSPTQFFEWNVHGPDHIQEILEFPKGKNLQFKISPSSFFQPNTIQAERLYAKALDMLSPYSIKTALDLYCGTGTIALVLSRVATSVIGIEINPYAIFDAESNCSFNNISGVNFFCGDVGKVLEKRRQETNNSKIDLVAVDPPRSGLDEKAIAEIVTISPTLVLYISCNPKTQAENISQLKNAGYFLEQIQPVDQFPNTAHVENIALLKKV